MKKSKAQNLIIDFHTHIYPSFPESNTIETARLKLRTLLQPVRRAIQEVQPQLRDLHGATLALASEGGALTAMYGLLIESSRQDLLNSMRENGVQHSILVAHPPVISNLLIMNAIREHKELIPCVQIPVNATDPLIELNMWYDLGARLLKLHPLQDGFDADSKHYRDLLDEAVKLKMDVILHTGVVDSRLLFRGRKLASVENFAVWFEDYRDLRFVLAHMNMGEPEKVWEQMQKHDHLWTTTSYQPSEVIAEATRCVGASRIFLASDWPLLGDNQAVALARLQETVDNFDLSEADARKIRGESAAAFLNLQLKQPSLSPAGLESQS